jgi:hypothetical protein
MPGGTGPTLKSRRCACSDAAEKIHEDPGFSASRPDGELQHRSADGENHGFNLLDYITAKTEESPRKLFFYFSDEGDVLAVRWENWKIVFLEQRKAGTLGVWLEPFAKLRAPKMYNLRTDPFEFADIMSNTYYDWQFQRAF